MIPCLFTCCYRKVHNLMAKISITTAPLFIDGLKTPLQLFSPLASQPWAMWLDSCDSEHVDAKFDIMVWHPLVTIETRGPKSTVSWQTDKWQTYAEQQFSAAKHSATNDDPLAVIEKLQKSIFKNTDLADSDLPFIGGALGYFGYDLGQRFEQLPTQAQHDIDLPDMAVGIYQQALIYDRAQKQFYLVCEEGKRADITTFLKQSFIQYKSTDNAANFALQDGWQSNISKAQYFEKFAQVQEYLLSGDCYQINLAQRFQANYQGDEFLAYQALRAHNQAPFSAFIRFNDAAVLSISPERFLKLANGQVQSKPIKGTKPRSTDAEIDKQNAIDLLHSEKDRAENLMIVDLLRNDISKVCIPGTVTVPKLFDIESFPAVHHLVSTVIGELAPEHNATDLLRGAFPGGSITGAPKIRAMEVIDELEPHHRSVYCGAIGYISACGNMDTSITIRTLACKDNTVYCWAGGGLVADSTPESEYQETFDKVAKILPVLAKLAD